MDSSAQSETNKKYGDNLPALTVRPKKLERLDLGTYPSMALVPEFHFDFLPDRPEEIGVSHTYLASKDGIQVIYQFQNFGGDVMLVFPRKLDGSK